MRLKNKITATLLALSCMSFIGTAQADQYKVLRVTDGDTIKVLTPYGEKKNIRLYGIDCPEVSHGNQKGQAYGVAAKRELENSITNGKVDLDIYEKDRYGRSIAVVYSNGLNLNKHLVETGAAMVYTRYCKDTFCSSWKDIERQAENEGLGLWGESHMEPWTWRKENK